MWRLSLKQIFICQILCIVMVLVLSNITFAASSGEIYGVVREAESGNPLPGANIMLQGTAIGTASDLEGRYLISGVPPGTYTLIVRYMGFEEYMVPIKVSVGQRLQVDADLVFKVVEGKVVTVTAQYEGQAAAINRQLTSRSIVNVVSAERIREMPDINAAESVGRLPGISITREGGEGQKVVIRGLAPAYNTVTVGGNKVPSSDLEDRSIDMSMISSDMLAGIEVIKAITPDRDADAFGGIVDFQVAKAREGGFRGNFRLQSGYNAQQLEYGQYKNSFRISQRFLDEKFGVLVTGNMERANRSADIYNADYKTLREKWPDEEWAPIVIEELELQDRIETLKRFGGNLMMDYQFDRGEILFTNFLNNVRRDRMTNERMYDPETNNDKDYTLKLRDISKEIFTSSLSGKYRFPFATIDARVSYNEAFQNQPHNQSFEFTEPASFNKLVYEELKEELGAEAVLRAAKNNIQDAGFHWGYFQVEKAEESDWTSQINMKIPYNFMGNKISGSISMGAKVIDKRRSTEEEANYRARVYQETDEWINLQKHHTKYGTEGFVWHTLSYSDMPSLLNYIDPDYDVGKFLGGRDYDFGPGIDRDELTHLANVYLIDSLYSKEELAGMDDLSSQEKISAGYIMTEINLGPRLMILPGVRYEHTYIKINAKTAVISAREDYETGSLIDTVATHRYENWFPMVHLRYRLTDWFDIRMARTRTISRAGFRFLNPREKRTTSDLNRGDITLKPQLSTNSDLFFTFHSYRLGLLTLGGFYKNIENLIWERKDAVILKEHIDEGLFPKEVKGLQLTQPENNPFDTKVYGFEIEWQTNFSWLPKPLDGIVINANYTRIWSETKYPYSFVRKIDLFTKTRVDTSREIPMPDQSDHIANLAIGYDIGGFSARLSMLYQGRTLSSIGGRPEVDGYTDDLLRWDFMVKQEINPWLSIFGAWNNINNSVDQSYIRAVKYLDRQEYYNWTADIGLVFKM